VRSRKAADGVVAAEASAEEGRVVAACSAVGEIVGAEAAVVEEAYLVEGAEDWAKAGEGAVVEGVAEVAA